ncbi:hypothetical protein DSL72_008439 [Monilinia vaccinii-corymbosi]|uniref:Major facilitator superfamily (MFS) profile domain-containing protein n=1 Tax=Monilinia vaccinii-corymbosi TaxID=61207 RepID=A0A8A3PKQ9_9HELO|nr:hypothetical protein DSL72_008439 [Monilinia vaccinii-corymbosi]
MSSSHHSDEETPLLAEPTTLAAAAVAADATIIPPDEPSTRHLVMTLGAIWVGVFLAALDSTIIATLSASISTSFHSLPLLSWLVSAYLIANAASQPLSGRLTDIFGRRTGLIVSNALFAAGNLICGLAGSEWVMILGRVVAGCGGGGLMAISTFVASDLVPLRRRGVVQGMGNICWGTGAGLGGIFGGWINDNWGWRMAFLVQVPFVVMSGILVACLVNIPPKRSEKSRLSRVDFTGSFTLVLTLVLLLLGLNSGGNIVPWNHPLVYVSLPLSLVFLLAFIYIELYLASEPVIPVRLLTDRTVFAACLANWFGTMAIYMIIFYVPLYYQVRGASTTASGMRLVPQSIGCSIGSLGSGIIMNRTGKYKAVSLITLAMLVVGTGLLSTMNSKSSDWPIYIYLALTGIGYGATLTTTLLAIISAVSHEHHSVVTSASYAFRSTGSTIGITIASAVYQNILKTDLWEKFGDRPGAEDVIRKIRDSFDELNRLPEGWKEGVTESYMDSFRGVFLTAFLFAVLMAGAGSAMRQNVLHDRLDRK